MILTGGAAEVIALAECSNFRKEQAQYLGRILRRFPLLPGRRQSVGNEGLRGPLAKWRSVRLFR